MKKQFQILSIAITIVLCSCGEESADNSRTITNDRKEFSINSTSSKEDLDLLLINQKKGIQLKAIKNERLKKLRYMSLSNYEPRYAIERNGIAKNSSRLKGRYGVN